MTQRVPPSENRNATNLTPQTRANIRTVAEIESKYLQQRSAGEKLGDTISHFSGTMAFFVWNIIWYVAWILVNVGVVPGLRPFDPYPFTFLTLMVSLEAIFLAIFVLASQNRMARAADQRAHLDLQINLLSEQENTKMLELLQGMAKHMGLKIAGNDDELDQLREKTEAGALLEEIEKQLPQQ